MTQKERILQLLREHPQSGVSNFELNQLCFRYGARLWDLRKEGHNIVSEKGKRKAEWIFRLVKESVQLDLEYAKAVE